MAAGVASAQGDALKNSIELYKTGQFAKAARLLETLSESPGQKTNAEVWNYLGLAYVKTDDLKKARKAFEKSVDLAPEVALYHGNLAFVLTMLQKTDQAQKEARIAVRLDPKHVGALYILGAGSLQKGDADKAVRVADQMIAADPAYPPGYMLKYSAMLDAKLRNSGMKFDDQGEFFTDAVILLEKGVEKSGSHPLASELRQTLGEAKAFRDYCARRKTSAVSPELPEPGTTPLKVVDKPKASYTEQARANRVRGIVRLAVLLRADGKIGGVLKLSRLESGLDEEAVKAARAIKFVPRMKDGKPVDTVVVVEYSFDIY